MITRIRKMKAVIMDHRQKRFVSYKDAIANWYDTRNNNYKIYNLCEVKKFKTSDTIFVLGNGPSLNQLNSDHIKMIKSCNSVGVSFSFLKKELTPTFHMPAMENTRDSFLSKFCQDIFSPYRKQYKDVVVFVNHKNLFRMAHPRLTPYIFPEDAKCYYFEQPEGIQLEGKRPFVDTDFDKSLRYRGKLTVVLHCISKLNYKNIVLLGVDLDKWSYFYENIEEMAEYLKKTYISSYGIEHVTEEKRKYVGMYPKRGKDNTLDEYLYALRDYLKRKKDVNLFIGFKNNMLYPKIPSYFD
jgi:hypothetical protein